MASALTYLEKLVSSIPSSSAIVIFLQEMVELKESLKDADQSASDLTQLCNTTWIRQRFHMTDIDSATWGAPYGQVTLIDNRLSVAHVSRLRFVSEYRRDAILVDIPVALEEKSVLRLCNVHLDSSYGSMRPIQWKAVAKHLQDQESGVVASILAGDCNANQPRDKAEPAENNFKDVYLELGYVEGNEDGATWGFQSAEAKRWGRQRLDKVVFWGDVKITSLERIGAGVKVEDSYVVKQLEELGELPFVTDHYGLLSELVIDAGMVTTPPGIYEGNA